MNKTIENLGTADQASVSRVAYELWENAGRPAGRDLEFWLAAEAKLRAPQQPAHAPVAVQPPATGAIQQSAPKARTNGRGGKKNWPKPYPSLPKF